MFDVDDADASQRVEDQVSRAFHRVMDLRWHLYARLARRVLAVEAVVLEG